MNLTYECPVKFDTRLSKAVAYLQLVYHRQLQPSFSDLFDVLDITKEEMKRRLTWTEQLLTNCWRQYSWTCLGFVVRSMHAKFRADASCRRVESGLDIGRYSLRGNKRMLSMMQCTVRICSSLTETKPFVWFIGCAQCARITKIGMIYLADWVRSNVNHILTSTLKHLLTNSLSRLIPDFFTAFPTCASLW